MYSPAEDIVIRLTIAVHRQTPVSVVWPALFSQVIVCLPVGQATICGTGGRAVVLCLVGGGGVRVGDRSGQGRTEA